MFAGRSPGPNVPRSTRAGEKGSREAAIIRCPVGQDGSSNQPSLDVLVSMDCSLVEQVTRAPSTPLPPLATTRPATATPRKSWIVILLFVGAGCSCVPYPLATTRSISAAASLASVGPNENSPAAFVRTFAFSRPFDTNVTDASANGACVDP